MTLETLYKHFYLKSYKGVGMAWAARSGLKHPILALKGCKQGMRKLDLQKRE